MTALGTKGVGVNVFVGCVVEVAAGVITVADGVGGDSIVSGAGAQPIKASIMAISNSGIADL